MFRRPTVRVVSCLLAVIALATSALAQTPLVPSGSFSVEMLASGPNAPDGTITSRFHEGAIRLEVVAGVDAFVVLFVERSDGYVLQALEGPGERFEISLEEMLADDDVYEQFADILLLMLHPESPIHPCVHTPPADGVLTGDFGVWDCVVVGSEMLGGRSTTVWELEFIWGRAAQMAVYNDPKHTLWIDDELGVPIAFQDGFGDFSPSFGAIDASAQDPSLFSFDD
jgi:hypothetical protein